MKYMDLNADIGEANTEAWAYAETQILAHVSSANIACGGHAGDERTMRHTLRAARENHINVGAHPSYPDKKNFGRKSLILGQDISPEELQNSLTHQIMTLMAIAKQEGLSINYVKPHGALYNDAVRDSEKADIITKTIKQIEPSLTLLGGPNSEMLRSAKEHDLSFVAEGFIDRCYTDQGHLLSRSEEGAVLASDTLRINQALTLAKHNQVKTNTGQVLHIKARSLCLHGDSQGAVATARKTRTALEAANITIRSFIPSSQHSPKISEDSHYG